MNPTPDTAVGVNVIKTIVNLSSGHTYDIAPNFVYYKDNVPVHFFPAAHFTATTACNTPVITIYGNSGAPICAGASMTLTATGASTYIWSPSGSLSQSTGSSVIASPATTTTYTITGNNGGSCTASTTTTINVAGAINPGISSPVTICLNDQTTLTASGGNSYVWSPATGLSSTNGASVTASPSVTTTYSVTISNGSCSAVKTTTVTVAPQLNMTMPSDVNICIGESVVLDVTSDATSFVWTSSPAGFTSTLQNPTVNPLVTTTYYLSATNGGCTKNGSVTITPVTKPIITSLHFTDPNQDHVGTLTVGGIFPGGVSEIFIDTTYMPLTGDETEAIFQNVHLFNGDMIILWTVSNQCFTDTVYDATASIEVVDPNTIVIKEDESISLFDIMGRQIAVINSPKDFSERETFEVERLFGNLPAGVYIWLSPNVKAKKFVR
jgi:hypothetical protein